MWLSATLIVVAALAVPASAQRTLAPGVMKSVDPERKLDESFSRHDVVELLAVDATYGKAKNAPFRHEVWTLDFKFKPVRMIWVDMPQDTGKMRRKLIWYMVFSVTNPGKALQPVVADAAYKGGDHTCMEGTYKVVTVDKPVRFIPEFLLEGHESVEEGTGFSKVYPDRVIPIAKLPIERREKQKLENTVDICQTVKPGETVWGVATWENVDPKVDRFSIYVQGLTNAYRWSDQAGAFKKGSSIGTGRRLSRKTLKLNFWRPGDEYYPDEREIRYGIPGEVDYEWVYR